MKTSDLVRLYPELHHMSADGSWPSIERHGLLSTEALLDKWEVRDPAMRSSLLENRRFESVAIAHPQFGEAVVRDQKPLNMTTLSEVLTDMSTAQWLAALNDRVYFFLQTERLDGLLSARSYRDHIHTVVTVDTAKLVAAYESAIELCSINSGTALPHSRGARGSDTFKSIAAYPHRDRETAFVSAAKVKSWDVSELTVRHSVPDIRDFVTRVERRQGAQVVERLT